MSNFLCLENVSFFYRNQNNSINKVIQNFSLEVTQGEIVSLVGVSGCGKTTIIKLISGLLPTNKGRISLQDQSIIGARKRGLINYVPQQNILLPHLTVKENILLPLRVCNKKVNNKNLKKLLNIMSLHEIANQYPHQLSGGMSQRVATARALITKPKLLLMDEPFASLDEFSREKINEDILKWQKRHNTTILFVTHNIQEAVFLSNRIIVIGFPDAKILAEIKIKIPDKNKTFRTTSGFYGYINAVKRHIYE